MKTCSRCKQEKPLDDFHRNNSGRTKDGRFAYCKACSSAGALTWRKRNPERYKETQRKWRKANPEKVKAWGKDWLDRNPGKGAEYSARSKAKDPEAHARRERNARYKAKYGITLDEYEATLAKQGGACAICKSPPGRSLLCVDHDHITGKARGLLCDPCNNGLGRFGDDVERLRSAVAYLRRYTRRA